jgi:hypothetical protein
MMLATRKLLSKIGGSKEREDALSYDFVASASNFAVGGKRSDAKRKKGGVNGGGGRGCMCAGGGRRWSSLSPLILLYL